ncbi:MAG: MATE family efflux transporter [Oscillospiraceae bacterium]|nr:MATE family efflux transporter [Oscillospiraceae bacterium]
MGGTTINTRNNYITEGPILSGLIKFSLPILLSLFIQALYGGVDILVIGQFAGVADQSAVSTGSELIVMITMVISSLAMGITILVGESVGAGRPEEAGNAIGAGIAIFAVLTVIVTAVLAPFGTTFASLMHAPEEALSKTADYISICGGGALFIVAYNILGSIFRGLGDSKTPLMAVAIASAFNIAGDILLVAGFKMGAAGAAIATVAAQGLSIIISLAVIRKRDLPFRLRKEHISFRGGYALRVIRVGTPIAIQDLVVSLSFIVVHIVVNDMGVTTSAAVGVSNKVCNFLLLIGMCYMQGVSAFVAQNNGAGRRDRSRKTMLCGIYTSFITGVVCFCASFFAGGILSSLFSNSPEVIAISHEFLKAYAFDCLMLGALMSLLGYFNGCEHTFFVMLQGLIGALCIRTPLVLIFGKMAVPSPFLIGIATPASTIVQLVMGIIVLVFIEKKDREKSILLSSDND